MVPHRAVDLALMASAGPSSYATFCTPILIHHIKRITVLSH
jgi:hypothetical protein